MLRGVLIESFAPHYDTIETHAIEIAAPPDTVFAALRTTDFTASPIIKTLMFLRSGTHAPTRRGTTLTTLASGGFGQLADDGREFVLGVAGQFWRPRGNLLPFDKKHFEGTIPPGTAIGVWNFAVAPLRDGTATRLTTETRVVCADAPARRRFRAYWFVVGPFSALIRRVMLRAVRRECLGRRA
jgi:hypothetical protein